MNINLLYSKENLEKYFSIPFITSLEGIKVSYFFASKLTSFSEGKTKKIYFKKKKKSKKIKIKKKAIRTSKPIDPKTIDVMYLIHILSRTQDNFQQLNLKHIIIPLITLIKDSFTYKTLYSIDIKNIQDTSQILTQSTLQLLLAYSFQIITNFISFQGFWSFKHPFKFLNEQIAQFKGELFHADFLLHCESLFSLFSFLFFFLLLFWGFPICTGSWEEGLGVLSIEWEYLGFLSFAKFVWGIFLSFFLAFVFFFVENFRGFGGIFG